MRLTVPYPATTIEGVYQALPDGSLVGLLVGNGSAVQCSRRGGQAGRYSPAQACSLSYLGQFLGVDGAGDRVGTLAGLPMLWSDGYGVRRSYRAQSCVAV